MLKRVILIILFCLSGLAAFQIFYVGTPGMTVRTKKPEIIAHRGVHQNYSMENMDWQTTCTASRIFPPTHEFIENTIESIAAAFEMGATIVEIDMNRTADDHLVVFHDWMLDCRTEGHGKVNESPLAYLKTLDVGYGYTADSGRTYPFRGKGIGKMPTFAEVLQQFPDRKFLLDHKDGSMKTTELLATLIKLLPPEQQSNLTYWGPDDTFNHLHSEVPAIRRLLANRRQHKQWIKSIWLKLGFGALPAECRDQGLGIYPKYTFLLPGWPYRFLDKVNAAGARFYIYIETAEEARKYAHLPVDGFITDYIERVGAHLK